MSPDTAKMLAQGVAEAASLGIGAAVGGAAGAASALGTDTNNRQMHWKDYTETLVACRKNPTASGCGTILKMAGVKSQILDFMAMPTANVAVNTDPNGKVVSYTLLDKTSNQPLAIMEPMDFGAFRSAPAGIQALTLRVSPQYSLDMASAALEVTAGNTDKALDAGTAVITSPEYWRDAALGVVGEIVSVKAVSKPVPGSTLKATVTAEGKVGNDVFNDVNQTARPVEQANADQPTLIADRVNAKADATGKMLPNGNMADAHAEIGVIQQAFDSGKTSGADMAMNVAGKDVCGYCRGDIAAAANKAGLNSLVIHAVDDLTGLPKTYYWLSGMKSIKERP